jgi:hypothetical protein
MKSASCTAKPLTRTPKRATRLRIIRYSVEDEYEDEYEDERISESRNAQLVTRTTKPATRSVYPATRNP